MKLAPLTLLSVSLLPAVAQELSVDQIMARVAENQASAQEMRRAFVYNQKVLATFRRGNGKIARHEKREYTVTPTPQGTDKKLAFFQGQYQKGSRMISYDEPGQTHGNLDIDGELLGEMIEEMTADQKTKDGIGHDLFPLTAEEQEKYIFTLEGKDVYRGKPIYRVSFRPKPHTEDGDWKGEALIDAAEFQPLTVNTKNAWHIPAAVKVLLGTDIKGLGFSVTYQKFDEGLWFPVSYGGEFHVRAVFFYSRTMSISMVNSGFQRADISSRVAYDVSGK
jgi:hypothetical protein